MVDPDVTAPNDVVVTQAPPRIVDDHPAEPAGRQPPTAAQELSAEPAPEPSPGRRTRSRRSMAADAIAVALLTLLLALAPASYFLADRLPVRPAPLIPAVSAAAERPGIGLRMVPGGQHGAVAPVTPADLRPLAEAVLGPKGADDLIALLAPQAARLSETAVGGTLGFAPYPYRYPALTALLDAAPGGGRTPASTALGEGLLALAARPGDGFAQGEFPNASPAAYAVLDRARDHGDCLAQLDLLLLLSADDQPRDAPVRAEMARAEQMCPHDPTPGWLYVQYLSQRMGLNDDFAPGDPRPADGWHQALDAATGLADRFPTSAAVVATLGDVRLRQGLYEQELGQPFTARQSLRAAAEAYQRARALGSTDAVVGMAKTLTGLGQPAQAAAMLHGEAAHGRASGLVLETLLNAEESAHQFADAARTGRDFAARGGSAYPTGPDLFAVPYGDGYFAHHRNPFGPVSVGVRGFRTFTVSLQPAPGGAGTYVEDLSFLPDFRPDDDMVTSAQSCPAGAWLRDAIVSGDSATALSALAGRLPDFTTARPTQHGASCFFSAENLRDVARLELGLAVQGDRSRRDELADKRQNMWRWAGDLDKAERVARAWVAADGLDDLRADPEAGGIHGERLDNNQATTDLALGRLADAQQHIASALRADPQNPAFLMTQGFVHDRADRKDAAARADRAALAADPGAYPAANDLGVELAREHHDEQAARALRQAVGARPTYALGWFNLGVVLSRMGPANAPAAQGAFAHAFRLDASLRDHPRRPTIDEGIYRVGLDVSRPLPPGWSLSRIHTGTPVPAVGVLAAVLLALGLARLAGSSAHADVAKAWLESTLDRLGRVRWLDRLQHPGWAVAVTAAVFAVPAAVSAQDPIGTVITVTAGTVLLAFIAMRVRLAAARRAGVTAEHRSWVPGMAFGAVAAPFAPWAPLPVVKTSQDHPRVHAAAPLALAAIGIVLFVEATLIPLPALRALAGAAIVMVASVLVPLIPLDGARLGAAGLLAGAGLVGAVFLLSLGVMP